MIHELKTWPEYFEFIWIGDKPFEVRKNDRDFQVGDILQLREYVPGNTIQADAFSNADIDPYYTGREMDVRVSYILSDGQFGIEEGFVVMGIQVMCRRTEGAKIFPCKGCEEKFYSSEELHEHYKTAHK
jgi:hypothetical protein